MAWLSAWIKEIIVVVLIASFADMLLPNKSMQRYVKTVIGLFLLMILLSPVLRLFRMDWNTDQLLRSIQQQSTLNLVQPAFGQSAASASLEAIQQEAARLKAQDNAAAMKLVEERVAESVKEEVESRFGDRASEVKVLTVLDSAGSLHVASMKVVLEAPGRTLPAWSNVQPIQPISSMAPIVLGGTAERAITASTSVDTKDSKEIDRVKNPDAVTQYLASTWQVEPENIEIVRPEAEEGSNRR
ncbi:stage III sporulation protein AF [Gorillibacterium timonense]|uniref:stage III sporulation protein AF n=1 Tax=Gorillibacterium timonense TaxID=1689269 RepID=UPI00071DE184|nr:stage III sporulation protein AF [Gorillibacterium timonense]